MAEKVSKETEQKIQQLTMMQQQLQIFASQKQQFQLQLAEVENALEEMSSSDGATYRLVGGVLIEKDKKKIKEELDALKSKLDLRIKSIEKQEKSIRDKATDLQKELSKELK